MTATEPAVLQPLDRVLASFVTRLDGRRTPGLGEIVSKLSVAMREGHLCLDAGEETFEVEALGDCGVVGSPEDSHHPLILDGGRLYTRRNWIAECRLAEALLARARGLEPAAGLKPVERAIEVARNRDLLVVSGGPGTGKTTIIVRLLEALLQEPLAETGRFPIIRLAAPTGKAAGRMEESIREQREEVSIPEAARDSFPREAMTLHRLIGATGPLRPPRHHSGNPLPLDVLVVDEASMVDLAQMTRVVEALPPTAKLILLGDKDQLKSVEAGAVLRSICGAADLEGSPLRHSVVFLTENWRFDETSGIGNLAQAINRGDVGEALAILDDPDFPDVGWEDAPLREIAREHCQPLLDSPTPEAALRQLAAFQVLCAVRRGPDGVEKTNARLQRLLRTEGNPEWFHGRPVLVTENNYDMNLYNGDVGVVGQPVEDEDDGDDADDGGGGGELRVYFPQADGSLRDIDPCRLPPHETVFAMTVHKSQGSQFEHVLLQLPNRESPVLTRELVYTAVTRASERVAIRGSQEVLAGAIATQLPRSSGLLDRLRG